MALGRVLIVDDQSIVRQAVGLVLTKAGYDVIEAEDGAKAIEIIEERQNGSNVDTMICDLQMPNVDGDQTITYVKGHYPHIPIIIMTGAPDFVLTEVLKNQGITDYLIKPVRDKHLLEVVRATVRLHQLRKTQP
jgi:two-component system, chemotaxis family, chemotaxis protein CheY